MVSGKVHPREGRCFSQIMGKEVLGRVPGVECPDLQEWHRVRSGALMVSLLFISGCAWAVGSFHHTRHCHHSGQTESTPCEPFNGSSLKVCMLRVQFGEETMN